MANATATATATVTVANATSASASLTWDVRWHQGRLDPIRRKALYDHLETLLYIDDGRGVVKGTPILRKKPFRRCVQAWAEDPTKTYEFDTKAHGGGWYYVTKSADPCFPPRQIREADASLQYLWDDALAYCRKNGLPPVNHLLVTWYPSYDHTIPSGSEKRKSCGISYHSDKTTTLDEDGPLLMYSLGVEGDDRTFQVATKPRKGEKRKKLVSYLLEPGTLVVMSGSANRAYQHQVNNSTVDRYSTTASANLRISCVFRRALSRAPLPDTDTDVDAATVAIVTPSKEEGITTCIHHVPARNSTVVYGSDAPELRTGDSDGETTETDEEACAPAHLRVRVRRVE